MTVLFLLRYKETAFKTFTNENNPLHPTPCRLSNRIKMLSPPDIFCSPIRSPPDIFYSPIRFTEMLRHYAYSMTSSVSTPKIHIFQERIQLWNGKGSQCFLRSTNFSTYTTGYMLQERTALNTHTHTHTNDIYILPKSVVEWSYCTASEWPDYEAFIDVMTCSRVDNTDVSQTPAVSIFMTKKSSNSNVERRGFSERFLLSHEPLFLIWMLKKFIK